MYYSYNIYFNGQVMVPPDKGFGYVITKNNEVYEIALSTKKDQPSFLGVTCGRKPIYINCNHCEYIGYSNIEHRKGISYIVFGMLTFGIGFCSKMATDTYHHCPTCSNCIGYATFM